jgi:hypothetical protein
MSFDQPVKSIIHDRLLAALGIVYLLCYTQNQYKVPSYISDKHHKELVDGFDSKE